MRNLRAWGMRQGGHLLPMLGFITSILIHPTGGVVDDTVVDLCSSQEDVFQCDESQCVETSKTCNGISECQNGRDESVEICGCASDEFQCNRTHCIDIIMRCNREPDCGEGEDEQGCENFICLPTHIKCQNNMCVPLGLSCDYKDDCGDGTDETNCDYRACYPSEWMCNNSQCISSFFLCDGTPHCLDGSDEQNCHIHVKCDNGLYVSHDHRCDGWVDCKDSMNDELQCACGENNFQCNNGRCLHEANRCDGVCDCGYQCDDESNCEEIACLTPGHFICNCQISPEPICKAVDRRCLRGQYVCNGEHDCWDSEEGHDEVVCVAGGGSGGSGQCSENATWCEEGKCLPREALCDNRPDCIGAPDEAQCEVLSECDGEYRCATGQCYSAAQRCDNVFDCPDNSDEFNCESFECEAGYKKCRTGQCIPGRHWCDFSRDCIDGSDEDTCDKPECDVREFRCHNGQCIPLTDVCVKHTKYDNRTIGCADSSHLLNCKNITCREGLFKCQLSYCVNQSAQCDQHPDCLVTLTDEEMCEQMCPFPSFECTCLNDWMNCENLGLKQVPDTKMERGLLHFRLSNNLLGTTFNSKTFERLKHLKSLDLSNNSIKDIGQNSFVSLWKLATLNLEKNNLRELRNGSFFGLYNVTSLYLRGNMIEMISPFAFSGLYSLKALDLSYQRIHNIEMNAFMGLKSLHNLDLSYNHIDIIEDGSLNGLPQLLSLDIRHNLISVIEDNVFNGLPLLAELKTDEFRFCCIAPAYIDSCLPAPDEFSSCKDLMSNYMLRVSIWVLGTVALLGNCVVIFWRIRDARDSKKKKSAKETQILQIDPCLSIAQIHSFLITNLALGDFFMGVYLILIASVDLFYRGVYSIHEKFWRESPLCKFAGFLSTFSSELSVLTLTVITIDRFISIIFPFRVKRMDIRETRIVMAILWIVVAFLSAIPLGEIEYFGNFYGRSGVCLALHITRDKPSGWEYAVFVFIVLNFVSLSIIFVSYLWMFIVARQTRAAARAQEMRNDRAMARRMTLIVLTDFCCWVPIILLGFASLGGATIPPQVFAWIAVFVLPFNAAINPVLYTLSTASFLGHARKRAFNFRQSFMSSLAGETKTSIVDDRFSQSQNLERTRYSTVSGKKYQQLELMNSRGYRRDSNNTTSPYAKRFRKDNQLQNSGSVESSLSHDPLRRGEVVYVYDADATKNNI